MTGEMSDPNSSSQSNRRQVDWARFGLSSDQNNGDTDVQFASKPSVLDETGYGGHETRANELFTEEQVLACYTRLSNEANICLHCRERNRGGNHSFSYHSQSFLACGMVSSPLL